MQEGGVYLRGYGAFLIWVHRGEVSFSVPGCAPLGTPRYDRPPRPLLSSLEPGGTPQWFPFHNPAWHLLFEIVSRVSVNIMCFAEGNFTKTYLWLSFFFFFNGQI